MRFERSAAMRSDNADPSTTEWLSAEAENMGAGDEEGDKVAAIELWL